ncbi:hypothetical protein SERLA73DRAFT_74493 [Serpula lacrymans var. lacrymans S7.3]|uniref:Uncharacterized protein n=1 Tax=Serpula lacrymans var. lacrymans (strain S7.3) TaxID=936435 RepID=F8PZE9_SERL3|nr:hypothetical protein SERLA73DRAFT_74493 [Serpula lacrymans var. lacrymans S7.3]
MLDIFDPLNEDIADDYISEANAQWMAEHPYSQGLVSGVAPYSFPTLLTTFVPAPVPVFVAPPAFSLSAPNNVLSQLAVIPAPQPIHAPAVPPAQTSAT